MTEQERKEFDGYLIKAYGTVTPNEYMQHEATWLAARRTQDAKVRELVEAAKAVIATITTQTPDPHSDVVVDYGKLLRLEDTLTQLKEQDDE